MEIDERLANEIMYHRIMHCETCEGKNTCGTSLETIVECINR